jgi:hypothetical protein
MVEVKKDGSRNQHFEHDAQDWTSAQNAPDFTGGDFVACASFKKTRTAKPLNQVLREGAPGKTRNCRKRQSADYEGLISFVTR